MTISYPLALPSHTGLRSIELRAANAVAYSRSPFTFAGQALAYPGQMWQADVTLPPMQRADAEAWVAWLVSLRGQFGTFTMGDPIGATPQGTALANRVNLLDFSEQFDNAYWTKGNSTITANSIASPDGLLTADTLVENTANSTHSITEPFAWVSGTTYTLSVYVKEQSDRNIRLTLPTTQFGGVGSAAIFDTTTGAVLAVSGGVSTLSQSVGNGWFRVSITKAATVSSSGSLDIRLVQGTNTLTYLGDGVSGAHIWGAQLEVGFAPTTYQPIFSGYGPFVNGAGQTGDSLVIDGASPDEVGYLLPGDYIQLGSGSTATLHKVLERVDTDSSGNATLTLWPHIRSAPADNAAVTLGNTVGRWRLASNETSWSVNEASVYGISFTAMEAV